MYVRKFEGDTLEDALRLVKMELGPDAIILKTVNNKGLRSTFKKKKFEITAAISENSYIKKAKVDAVLTDQQKQKFYNSDAGHVAKMINNYNGEKEVKKTPKANAGYGSLGLNKVVNSINKSGETIKEVTNKTASKIKTSLDEFLSTEEENTKNNFHYEEEVEEDYFENVIDPKYKFELPESAQEEVEDDIVKKQVTIGLPRNHRQEEWESSIKSQQQKIDMLENQLFELTRSIHSNTAEEQSQVHELRKTLKTLDIDEVIIQRIIKKASFELSKEELDEQDALFEFALRELNSSIRIGNPLFADSAKAREAVFTVLVSEVSSGQTSSAYKLAKMVKNSIVINYNQSTNTSLTNEFAVKMLDINIANANNIAELISQCRRANENGQKVFIDYKGNVKNGDETKKFIESLNRSFNNVEVVITLSAIHSEIFNRRIISKYQEMANKVIINHIDLCMNYGALVNLQTVNNEIEFLFYGNGVVIPEDIETATSERILAGMFQF